LKISWQGPPPARTRINILKVYLSSDDIQVKKFYFTKKNMRKMTLISFDDAGMRQLLLQLQPPE
jgi:hypothetical protein